MTTVVLDEACAQLESSVAAFASVVVFRRRAGFLSPSTVASRELREMLTTCSIQGRALYVAPSFAGFTAVLTAHLYPDALSGVILLDPSHPRQGAEAQQILINAPPSPERDRLIGFLAGFGPDWEESCRDVSRVRTLGELPLLILAGGRFDLSPDLPDCIKGELIQSRHTMLAEYARLSSGGVFEVVESAGHDIARESPEPVLLAIKRLLMRIETNRPGQPPEPTLESFTPHAEAPGVPAPGVDRP